MHLHYVQLDDRIDRIHAAMARVSADVREEFSDRLRASWNYHELQIEGVPLCDQDLRRALEGRHGRDYCDDVLLRRIRRHDRAMKRLQRAVRKNEPMSMGFVRDLYALLEGAGAEPQLRVKDGATGLYKHDTEPVADIEASFEALLNRINNNLFVEHPVALSIDVQYRVGQIWPFDKHSATIGRMLANFVLMSHGYPPIVVHCSERRSYYQAFHYDIRRLRKLLMASMEGQLCLQERFFRHVPAGRRAA